MTDVSEWIRIGSLEEQYLRAPWVCHIVLIIAYVRSSFVGPSRRSGAHQLGTASSPPFSVIDMHNQYSVLSRWFGAVTGVQ